jgi:hypothetical protein
MRPAILQASAAELSPHCNSGREKIVETTTRKPLFLFLLFGLFLLRAAQRALF